MDCMLSLLGNYSNCESTYDRQRYCFKRDSEKINSHNWHNYDSS